MSGATSAIYNSIFRSNATMLGAVFVSAFGIQMAFDTGSSKVWDTVNRGRQWKDIKQKYITKPEEDEEE
ncbi:ubiquinol-cytochrome C reductase [Trichodelitschia bisporula]|uniref:Complex III subunit 9 n=1 Tax=Trichodelitschia bisporula TaxID=703511 RepID=A0A6G1I3D0_9PEZI|nr:ubiquinol-cytochrome C reductase [Trichodelitschia bisporula]